MPDATPLLIETPDSHRFQATLFRSELSNAPTLLFLPALGTPGRIYTRMGQTLAKLGINACIPDWRGMASSSLRAGRTIDFGYRHLLEQDISTLIATLHTSLPGSSLWLGGHSLGGQLALLAAAAHPAAISGVVLIASGTVHQQCYPIKMRLGIRGVVALAQITGSTVGYFPGNRIGFGGREARSVMSEWGHVARTGNYRIAGSAIDYENGLKHLTCPVIAFNFSSDHWSPAAAADGLLGKVPAAKITRVRWTSEDTGGVAFDHFLWTKHPDLIAPTVARHMRAPTNQPD